MIKKRLGKQQPVVPRRRSGDFTAPARNPEPTVHATFRRGQTLSGYRSSRTFDESDRGKAHALVRQRRSLGAIFLIVAAVVVFLALILWQMMAQISVTTSTKQLTRQFDSAQYEKVIEEYLGLHPAERLRFALNQDGLTEYVSAQYPEVAKLTLTDGSSLAKGHFAVTFRAPVAGWRVNGAQSYVDQAGVVFSSNYYEEPTVQIVDESGIRSEKGSATVGNRLLGFLGKVVSLAGERGYTVTEAYLPQEGTRQVELKFKDIKTRIKLSIDRGAGEQIEDADRALKFFAARGESPAYVDVRVSGRAAYK